ncbi:MAG: carboxy terminal-processing peptidase [Deltaproteobacteria bacterium]|nr:carboxy terminal-processing peptidase [Deltaproteobacteria bacterium]
MSVLKRRIFLLSITGILLAGLVFSLFASSPQVKSLEPGDTEQQIAISVASLLKSEHLTRHSLNREISERCFNNFISSLDPQKIFFKQSDIDAFQRMKDKLARLIEQGDVNFAYKIFKVYLSRIDESVGIIESLLKEPQDFSIDEEMVIDKDRIRYPQTTAEARERWRKRLKNEILVLKADKADRAGESKDPMQPEKRLLRRYRSFVKQMHQTDTEDLLGIYLTALTTAFDPHSTYMTPRTMENFEITMRLQLEGIGAALSSVDGYTVVKEIISGGAADRDGRLKAGEKIVGVGEGADGEIIDVVDMKLNNVVKMIRGKKGTIVRLEVLSVEGERKIIDITRAKIELKDRDAEGEIFEFGQTEKGSTYKIGVIDIPSFYMDTISAGKGVPDYKSTTRDVRGILEEFNRTGVNAVVLDLRKNGGGALSEAINLTGLFIKEGPVLQVKNAEGYIYSHKDEDSTMVWSGPLVLMISKFSASASEILAGAIQDYGRGLVVGDHATHGKGTVQNLIELDRLRFRLFPATKKMGSLKITTQQFFRPSGASVQKRGVLADIELPSITTHLDIGESDLEYAIPYDKVPPLHFKRFDYVEKDLVDQLRRSSEVRIKMSEKFRKIVRDIERYHVQKNRVSINLNEAQFLKERKAFKADQEDETVSENMNQSGERGIKRDYYLEEVMAIVADYLELRYFNVDEREAA